MSNYYKGHLMLKIPFILIWLIMGAMPSFATENNLPLNSFKATVNGTKDTIEPDDVLTMREAIALINGTLDINSLSTQERNQVQSLNSNEFSKIEFNLPSGNSKIVLNNELPPITRSKVIIDGTTQSGYGVGTRSTESFTMPKPVVEITPSPGIARGLTLLADDITVKGLSIYGFHNPTLGSGSLPGANILIANQSVFGKFLSNVPTNVNVNPKGILLEGNWLGIAPDRSIPESPSDFGIYIFHSQGTTIRNNVISYHLSSGIITVDTANNLLVEENIIFGNGSNGIPDGIHLQGKIENNRVTSNLICANDGSGIFIFKPAIGAVNVENNQIKYNGRRLRRSAVYLMGNDNQVINNYISHQGGSGVTVTSFPQSNSPTGDISSARNIISNNRFAFLEGLSIDLNAHRNDGTNDFQNGDGYNPPRNSENRRLETGNLAIDAPRFLAREFYLLDNKINIDGIADPGSEVEIYRVQENSNDYGPLSEPLTKVKTDDRGRFGATLTGLKPGEMISAIATDPRYGTSEPARNAIVQTPENTDTSPLPIPTSNIGKPECLTGELAIPNPTQSNGTLIPATATFPLDGVKNETISSTPTTPPPTPPETPLPEKITIVIPRNIHFAFDKAVISPNSGKVLQEIAKVLKEHPYIIIDLEGHTDPRASSDYNKKLGLRRSMSVRDYLVRQGISPERMTIRSFGESKLRTPGKTSVDHARNRRVEIFYRDVRGIELQVINQENDLQLER